VQPPGQVQRGSGEGSEGSGEGLGGSVQSQVALNKVPEKGPGSLAQQGFREGSGEGWGGFCAEPGQVAFRRRSGSQVRFNRVLEKVPEKVWEALVQRLQSQVRFNRVSEKVPEKVWEALVQSQVRFNRICGFNSRKPT